LDSHSPNNPENNQTTKVGEQQHYLRHHTKAIIERFGSQLPEIDT
jgi:hypothetical protein